MSVDLAAVRRIAPLARIGVRDEELPHQQDEINAILSFVEALGEVDVEGVEPMTSVTPMRLPMREDVVTDGEIAEAAWFTRAEVRAALEAGDWTSDSQSRLLLPGTISIAREIIESWAFAPGDV